MSVILNEAALQLLLDSPTGPVGIDLARRAEQVAVKARENASGEIIGIQTGDLLGGIRTRLGHDERGLFASIGTDARHHGFAYPTFWDQHGKPWLTDALRNGFR